MSDLDMLTLIVFVSVSTTIYLVASMMRDGLKRFAARHQGRGR